MRTLSTLFTALFLIGPVAANAQFREPAPAPTSASASDLDAVKTVLTAYKTSLERLDLTGVERLFANDNQVIESGKVEGSYADYLANHIGPELGHFESFTFSDYQVAVRVQDSVAWATETYRYSIRLKDKPEAIERRGVATSVLSKRDGQWKIVNMHNSSRVPKATSLPKT